MNCGFNKKYLFLSLMLLVISPIGAAEALYLVISQAGNKALIYKGENESQVVVMAEIQGKLNFSIRGDFQKASIIKATTVAPDGKTYNLRVIAEQPPSLPGTWLKFLAIANGTGFSDFSIGTWKVSVDFEADGEKYKYQATYLVTWRKPNEGIWGSQHWANESGDDG